MDSKPIIFSAPMVRALLEGRKSQTRRKAHAPYATGDRLWVREAFAMMPRTAYNLPKTIAPAPNDDMAAYYRADFDRSGRPPWKPSIHMPRWASRLTLTVTAVKVERLQDISEADARAEGVRGNAGGPWGCEGLIEDFSDLWNSIYGPDAWDANPWVVAVSFQAARCNIDSQEGFGDGQ